MLKRYPSLQTPKSLNTLRIQILTSLWGFLLIGFVMPVAHASHHEQLQQNLSTLTVSITLHPFKRTQKDPGGGLRSLLLYTSDTLRIEPHAKWRDGSPASADAKLSKQNMLGVVNELKRRGILQRATLYHSAARQNPRNKPSAGKEYSAYLTERVVHPSCEITATYTKGDYHYYVVCMVPFGQETISTLNGLKTHIPTSLANALLGTCRRFQHRHNTVLCSPATA